MRPLILLAVLAGSPVSAQPPGGDAACVGAKVALPAELAGWSDQTPVSAGVKSGDGATIELGHATLVALHPAKHLEFGSMTGDANGGTLAVAVTRAGTYRVALGAVARVDLVLDGKLIASRAHAMGPRCSGVRKMVDFALTPGNYTVQLSGNPADSLALLIVRVG